MNFKKLILTTTLTSLIMISYGGANASAANIDSSTEAVITQEADSKGATTAYKYWAITSSSRVNSRLIGSEKYLTSFATANNGNSHTVTHTQAQSGSPNISISVTNGAIGASIGYTPGTSVKVSVSTTSGRYKAGTTVAAYTQNREDIWTLNQSEYETNNALGIKDKYTGNSKQGTAYKPASPQVRFSPSSNY